MEIEAAQGEIRRSSSQSIVEFQKSRPRISVDPHGSFRNRWDVLSVIFICYSAFMLPFQASFQWDEPRWLQVIHWMIDIFFGLDILVNFITGVCGHDELKYGQTHQPNAQNAFTHSHSHTRAHTHTQLNTIRH